jgi:hypothetical protein
VWRSLQRFQNPSFQTQRVLRLTRWCPPLLCN